jgi:hypothetical protein
VVVRRYDNSPAFGRCRCWKVRSRVPGLASGLPLTRQDKHGPQTWCRTEFAYYGLAVKAFVHIPATPASN